MGISATITGGECFAGIFNMEADLVALVRRSEQRFWPKVDKRGPDECWEWKEYRRKGYGYFRVYRRATKLGAHQVVFILKYGYLPPMVRHSCDNPGCCNPAHLLPGDHRSNMDDVIARKRQAGERNASARLTERDVRAIRADKISTNIALGEKYGVTHSMISAIRLGKAWRHVS